MKRLLKDSALWREAAYIGGEWVAETPHGRYALHNPADGALLVELPRCREDETRHAIDAAQAAFGPWRRTTAKARGEVLRRWYELIVQHKEDLATLITLEEGKPLAEARGGRGDTRARRCDSRCQGDAAHRRAARPDRRLRRDHAVELPCRDDHAQGRAGAGGWLHDGRQAREPDADDRARTR